MGTVAQERLEALLDQVRQTLHQAGVLYQNLHLDPIQQCVLFTPRDAAHGEAARRALAVFMDDEVSLLPGGVLAIAPTPSAMQARMDAVMRQSVEIVRRRIDETGIVDPEIARQGENRLVVQLPGVEDPNRIKDLLGRTAHMTFQLVEEMADAAHPTPEDIALPLQRRTGGGTQGPAEQLVLRRHTEVDGADLTDARAGQNPQTGEWVVNFGLDSVGSDKFAAISTAAVGRRFAIVLDGQIVSAPVIREPITGGRGQISGNFTVQSATDLAVLLRAGALPAPLAVVEERSIGPELGSAAIRAGAVSLAVGFVLVVLFMGTFYGLFGWFANVALIVNLALQIAALSLLQATLTLPGMAGILLTLGMAVDANILVNERIREEARAGKTPLAAMEAGFRRAYATVIDSQATALLAHVMLFIFGAGPVRGFAVTITIGIATTLFSALLVARLLMVRWYAAHRPTALPV
jgi:preprotein translocase subunit SecD